MESTQKLLVLLMFRSLGTQLDYPRTLKDFSKLSLTFPGTLRWSPYPRGSAQGDDSACVLGTACAISSKQYPRHFKIYQVVFSAGGSLTEDGDQEGAQSPICCKAHELGYVQVGYIARTGLDNCRDRAHDRTQCRSPFHETHRAHLTVQMTSAPKGTMNIAAGIESSTPWEQATQSGTATAVRLRRQKSPCALSSVRTMALQQNNPIKRCPLGYEAPAMILPALQTVLLSLGRLKK